jgi:hypothetical protein
MSCKLLPFSAFQGKKSKLCPWASDHFLVAGEASSQPLLEATPRSITPEHALAGSKQEQSWFLLLTHIFPIPPNAIVPSWNKTIKILTVCYMIFLFQYTACWYLWTILIILSVSGAQPPPVHGTGSHGVCCSISVFSSTHTQTNWEDECHANGTAVGPIGLRPRDGSPRWPAPRRKVKSFCIHSSTLGKTAIQILVRCSHPSSAPSGYLGIHVSNKLHRLALAVQKSTKVALPMGDQSGEQSWILILIATQKGKKKERVSEIDPQL